MLIQSLLLPKSDLTTLQPTDTIANALVLLEKLDQRCLPVLDMSGTLFRGNIYKYHIYRHLAKGGSDQEPVTTLLKNAAKFILNTDSFFKLFFTLNDLPYIAVLNDKRQFLGVIRHHDVMKMLASSWHLTESSYALMIELDENPNTLKRLMKYILKFSTLSGVITLNRDNYTLRKKVIVTLPNTLATAQFDALVAYLTKKHFYIIETENLNNGI